VSEVLIHVLELCVGNGLFHLEVVHKLGRIGIARSLSHVFLLKNKDWIIYISNDTYNSLLSHELSS
jgi:hypothetical protein